MPKTAAPLLGALLVAGCGPAAESPPPSAGAPTERKLIDIGGIGSDATAAFRVKGRRIRIAYRFRTMPASRQAVFTVERESDAGTFDNAATATVRIPDSLSGSESVPLLPGSYRLRVQADVSWSATVFEPRA